MIYTGVNLFVRSFSCSILHYNGYSVGSEPNTSDFSLMYRNKPLETQQLWAI